MKKIFIKSILIFSIGCTSLQDKIYPENSRCGSYIFRYNQLNKEYSEISEEYENKKKHTELNLDEIDYYENKLANSSIELENALYEWQECKNMGIQY